MNTLFNKIPHKELYIFSLFVSLGILVFRYTMPEYVYHMIWILLLFFLLLNLASLMIIERVTKNKSKNIFTSFLGIIVGRLFLSIAFAAIFILVDRINVFNFAVNFSILYLLFVGFEIRGILTNLRHHFKNGIENG